MSSQDDPEARIRELERSLGDQASELTHTSSELGSGPYGAAPPPLPPPQTPYATAQLPYPAPLYGAPFPPAPTRPTGSGGRGWLGFVVIGGVMAAIIVGVAVFVSNAFSGVNSLVESFNGSPTAPGGGGPFGVPVGPSSGNRSPVTVLAPSESVVPPGGDISVAGVGDNRTIACNDNVVSISGVSNTVVLTGQCRSVSVSGMKNTVTVNAAATISASGFDNRITFLSGTPDIQNSGDSNVVEPG